MNGLLELAGSLPLLALTLCRITAVFLVVPIFGTQFIQGVVRNSIILSLSLILYPMVSSGWGAEKIPPTQLILLLLKEGVIGVLVGFCFGIIFWAAESVGFFIDNQRGTTMASSLDPMTGEQTSPLGLMLIQAVVVLFFTGGGFLLMLETLFMTYRVWPIHRFFPQFQPGYIEFFLAQTDRLMEMIVVLSAPIIIVIFLSEFSLGLISRFAPQLNVFFLSMPIKSALAIAILAVYIPTLYHHFQRSFLDFHNILMFLQVLIQ